MKVDILFLFLCVVILSACQKQDNNEIYLKKFTNTHLEELDFNLGLFDTFYVDIQKQKSNTIVQLYYNGTCKSIEQCWDGTFEVKNDTIILSVDYIESKDPNPNIDCYGAYTVVQSYIFNQIDTSKFTFYPEWFLK